MTDAAPPSLAPLWKIPVAKRPSEREVCAAAARWLRDRGYDVYGEVEPRDMGARFDLVGLRGSPVEVVIVESKTSLSKDLLEQLAYAATCGDRVYAALPWRAAAGAEAEAGFFGVLRGDARDVVCARSAPRSAPKLFWRAGAVQAACTRFHRDQPGGVTSAEGGVRLSPYRVLVYEVHSRLWKATTQGARGLQPGEVYDLVGDLFGHVKDRRASIAGLLERETAFWYDPALAGWVPTGLDVPQSAKPGAPVVDVRAEGAEAFGHDVPVEQCPYQATRPEAQLWRTGWREAQDDAKAREVEGGRSARPSGRLEA